MLVKTAGSIPKQSSLAIAKARDALRSSELHSLLDALVVAKPLLAEVGHRAIQEVPVPGERSGCHG